MSNLPDPALLARLISNVTSSMCATTFVPGNPLERGESLCAQMAMIPLTGERSFAVVVASDTRGSRSLASAFFGCGYEDLTQAMIDDAIAELLNMVAGQISAVLQLDLKLGLAHRTTLAEIVAASGSGIEEAVLFRSEGKIDLWLWVFEAHVATTNSASAPAVFRSILNRLRPASRAGSRRACLHRTIHRSTQGRCSMELSRRTSFPAWDQCLRVLCASSTLRPDAGRRLGTPGEPGKNVV